MSFVRQALSLVSASLLTVSFATAASAKEVRLAKAGKEPNCEVKDKKTHVKDKAACEKKKGKWLEADAAPVTAPVTPAPSTPAATPAPAAPAATTQPAP